MCNASYTLQETAWTHLVRTQASAQAVTGYRAPEAADTYWAAHQVAVYQVADTYWALVAHQAEGAFAAYQFVAA